MNNDNLTTKLAIYVRQDMVARAKSIRTSLEKLAESEAGTFGTSSQDIHKAIKMVNGFISDQSLELTHLQA